MTALLRQGGTLGRCLLLFAGAALTDEKPRPEPRPRAISGDMRALVPLRW
jgi:hypothetical protein